MRIHRRHSLLASFAAIALLAVPAFADPIPGLHNTGVDDAGNPLAQTGGSDPHYQVDGHPAVTYYNGAYYGPPNSQWLSERADGGYDEPLTDHADVTYSTTFDLTGLNPATARVSGNWGCDNYCIMYLNGQQVADNNNGFGGSTPFALTSGFKAGTNTLTILVRDYGPPAAFNIFNLVGTANLKQPPAWTVGQWSDWSGTCGESTRSRTVQCVAPDDGTVLDDAACTNAGAKPSASDSSYITTGCGYAWQTGDYGSPTPACGPTTETRSVTCRRSDGQTVDDSLCTDPRPPATTTVNDYSTCDYQWSDGSWSTPPATCGNATETRSVTCQRSDSTTVDDSQCHDAKPSGTQTVYQTSGCTYAWQVGDYGAAAPACGQSVETRSVVCVRSDTQAVDDGQCPQPKPDSSRQVEDTTTCGYTWAIGDWSTPHACGTATITRDVACRRDDGTDVADSFCAGGRPASSETVTDLSTCTYVWTEVSQNEWSLCANGMQSRTGTVACRRSDGTTADDSLCTGSKPDYYETRACGSAPTGGTTPAAGDVVMRRPFTPAK